MNYRRRAIIGLNKTRLPAEYQELKYIASTGTQYIDPGISNYLYMQSKIEAKFKIDVATENNFAFGFHTYGGYGTAMGAGRYSGQYIVDAGSYGMGEYANISNSISKTITMDCSTADGRNVNVDVYENGVFVKQIIGDMKFSFASYPNFKIILFGIAKSWWNATIYGKVSMAGWKLYDNTRTLIRDLVPCYRKLDDKPGMYDVVNDVFYTNQGTGEFLIGPNA